MDNEQFWQQVDRAAQVDAPRLDYIVRAEIMAKIRERLDGLGKWEQYERVRRIVDVVVQAYLTMNGVTCDAANQLRDLVTPLHDFMMRCRASGGTTTGGGDLYPMPAPLPYVMRST